MLTQEAPYVINNGISTRIIPARHKNCFIYAWCYVIELAPFSAHERKSTTAMQEPFFKPWVGEDYRSQVPKTLVLGESHYGISESYTPEFTQYVVKDWALCQRGSSPYFTKIAKILLSKPYEWISLEEKYKLWNRVAFYNYVQQFVGDRPRMRPTPEMWLEAEEALDYVIAQLTPDIVIVTGKELGYYVSSFEEKYIGPAKFCYWTHPSARTFKKEDAIKAFEDVKRNYAN